MEYAIQVKKKDVVTNRECELLVSLPALNEERTIRKVVEGIPRELPGISRVRILVIDDGSTDRTGEEAREAGAVVLSHRVPRGVGEAFHAALRYGIDSGADLIVTIDSDGQFDPLDIPKLIEPVLSGQADFATASRFKDATRLPKAPLVKIWGNRMMSWLVSRLTGQRFSDVSCGFRCYGQKAILSLHLLGRFTYTQEVFLNLAFKQLRIVEIPVVVQGVREHGESRVAKNLFAYAFNTSRIIFQCYRDYHPLRFFGAAALFLIAPAAGLELFLLWHYLQTGAFSPHKWAGFVGASLFILALMMVHMGMIGDMLNRHRVYLEELLYYRRLQDMDEKRLATHRALMNEENQAR